MSERGTESKFANTKKRPVKEYFFVFNFAQKAFIVLKWAFVRFHL